MSHDQHSSRPSDLVGGGKCAPVHPVAIVSTGCAGNSRLNQELGRHVCDRANLSNGMCAVCLNNPLSMPVPRHAPGLRSTSSAPAGPNCSVGNAGVARGPNGDVVPTRFKTVKRLVDKRHQLFRGFVDSYAAATGEIDALRECIDELKHGGEGDGKPEPTPIVHCKYTLEEIPPAVNLVTSLSDALPSLGDIVSEDGTGSSAVFHVVNALDYLAAWYYGSYTIVGEEGDDPTDYRPPHLRTAERYETDARLYNVTMSHYGRERKMVVSACLFNVLLQMYRSIEPISVSSMLLR